jgi:NAD(P)-dependent dehydrogenase (short-subunit alcohol dehydrogenase family)
MDLLEGAVVMISGGSQGVGASCARRAALEGARAVAVSGRHRERADNVLAEIADAGAEPLFIQADVADVEQARGSVRQVVERFGRVDAVVNSAAITTRGSVLEATPELFDQHIAVNLRAPFFIIQEAAVDMIRRGQPGSIVNIITMASHGGAPELAAYAASKAGLVGLTKNAAHALRWQRIRVNGLNLGWTETPAEDEIQRRFHGAGDGWQAEAAKRLPMGKLGQPDEIAHMVVLLLSAQSGVVTGSIIDWDQTVVGGVDSG